MKIEKKREEKNLKKDKLFLISMWKKKLVTYLTRDLSAHNNLKN